MAQAEWIAVDWGTTHLRGWAMAAGGRVVGRMQSDQGMGKLRPDQFEGALLALIEDYLTPDTVLPVVCCGMVGAAQGWIEAPYVTVPAPPPSAELAVIAPVHDPRISVRVLPGMKQAAPADVMRGEETQIAGYLAQDSDFDGVICLPGTHTKWAQISAGEIVSFRTFMTGEMFALLSTASVLKHSVQTDEWDADAFTAAIRDAMSDPHAMGSALFRLRAEGILNALPPAAAKARLSGLLLGQELAGARPYWLGQRVALIGSKALAASYADALRAQGVTAEISDGEAMTLAGLSAAYQSLKERRP